MKIYIAGPITGNEYFEKQFADKEYELTKKGYTVLNPATLPAGMTQKDYMTICISMINCADKIYMLDGYRDSAGALVELVYAEKIGLPVEYEVEE